MDDRLLERALMRIGGRILPSGTVEEKRAEIRSMDRTERLGVYFSECDGNYPRGMTECYVHGLAGDCGTLRCVALNLDECVADDPIRRDDAEAPRG